MEKRKTNRISAKKKNWNKYGIWSLVFAFIELILLATCFFGSLWNAGQANTAVGVLELFIFVGSIFGIIYGIQGRKQKNVSHIVAEIGIASNALLMIIIIILFVIGMGIQ